VNGTVAWEPEVWNELHQLWAIGPDSAAVRSAAEAIEKSLTTDPIGSGRHLSEGLWRIVVVPLVVHYIVDSTTHHVEITDCARARDNQP
jgi:hypothetical protein